MHIQDILSAASYRVVEGRDGMFDFLGKDCRELVFESWGLHDPDEHYPVSVIFCCGDGDVKQITTESENGVHRWLSPNCHAGYVLACADIGEQPWQEPGMVWVQDPNEILRMIPASLHPERKPDDNDQSYRWETGDVPMQVEREDPMGDVIVNP